MTKRSCLYSLRKHAGGQSDSPHLPAYRRQLLPNKIGLFVLFVFVIATSTIAQRHPADFVNPFIGTAPPEEKQFLGNNPPPGEELYYGCVSPAAMTVDPVVKLGPNTGFDGIFHVRGSSYRYTDTSIMGFTHLQHEYNQYANILFMPTVGPVQTTPGSRENPESGYRSPKDFKREKASAGYYARFSNPLRDQCRTGCNQKIAVFTATGFPEVRNRMC